MEQETEQGWSVATEIEATSADRAVTHAAKGEGTYRVRAVGQTKTQHFRVPAGGPPQLLRRGNGRSLSSPTGR